MALEDTSYFYEALLRGRSDGSIAAHVVYARRIVNNGEVLKDEPGVPQVLDLKDAPAVAKVMGDVVQAAVAAQDKALSELEATRLDCDAKLQDSSGRLAEAQAATVKAEGERDALADQLEHANGNLANTQAELEGVRAELERRSKPAEPPAPDVPGAQP